MKATVLILAGLATLVGAGLATTGLSVFGAGADPKAAVAAAARRLADQPSFSWKTTVETGAPGPLGDRGRGGAFGGGPATGQVEKDGYLRVAQPNLEFVTKGGKAAVLLEDNWQTLEQAAARGGGGFGRGAAPAFTPNMVTTFKLPPAQAEEYLAKATAFKSDGATVTATLSGEVVGELLSGGAPGFGGRAGLRQRPEGGARGRGGPPGGTWRDPKGSVTFWINDGLLTKFTVALSGTRDFRGEATKVARITTTTITDVSSTKVEVAADAKDIVDALLAGTTPKVFVPEPGFKKLFNGRDLTGWAGRPGHWSVEDGAITGRTTKENPARGNNFLIAKVGDNNLIVDDFELRLSFRLSGPGNSGIQYRSQERPNFVVAGYQADFDGAHRFSGILYDEAGGAGGRGIMAQRGEKVVWNAQGKKEVTGRLGKPEEIQAAIKKDDWNEYVILARGNHLQHFINGVQTVDVFDDAEGKRLTAGVLALQLHTGPPMTVQFKDIRLKSLSSAAATAAGNVKVAKDFKLELLYLVPRETQGSWVALCVDPKGRLIVADQYGKLYRLTPPPVGQSGPIQPEPIELDIGAAHGLLYAFDSLYVMVTERTPRGLYRVRDTDGDDRFDEVQLLRNIEGGGEHGVHSLVLAPDGRSIYVVCGNATRLTEMDSSRVPLNWSEDNLLTRVPTGFMDNSLAPQGWVARTDPEGKQWELIAAGFRNQFDVAFNREGELFTYDADMEWDIGDPWYRPTRVNHVLSGAEFGFRNGSGKWPAYTLDSFGAVVDIGPGSPTGVTFGTGARFPAKYQDAFYICDWSFGKLYAIHLTPAGASYTGQAEEFVTGQPLPLTDVVINPTDGAMYFAVGGRRTQSALYRVTYVGSESTAPGPDESRFRDQRQLRRRLESFHGHADAQAVATVWPYLGDADRAIRYAARVALEWQDPGQWREKALGEGDARRAIAALVALARVSGKDEWHRREADPKPDPALQGRMLAALDRIDWSKLGHQDRLDLLRAYALVFTRLGPPDEATRQRLIAKLEPLFPAPSRELNYELCQTLVYLQAPGAAAKVLALLRAAPTQEEQVDYVLALRLLKTGWTAPLREEYFRWFVTTASGFRGGNTFASSLRRVRSEAVATLSDDEKAALKPILEAAPEPKSPQELLAARKLVKAWTVNELVPLVERGLTGGRDFERGRKLYGAVACAACHRFDQEGGSVGPDLTGVAGRFSVRDLLEAIVEPSKVISDQYAATIFYKKNGEVVTGRVGNLNGDSLSVIEDMFAPGRFTNVRRQDIEAMEPSKVSMMPEGLLNTLTEEEVQDLVAFLLRRGDSNNRVFR
jgi:putative heme-binding domain-containing protein